MKRLIWTLPLLLVLASAHLRAEDKGDKNKDKPPVEQTFTGHVSPKKKDAKDAKDAKADVVATLKTENATYQLVASSEDIGKQIKAVLNQNATVKGTLKEDILTVTSIEKKGGKEKK
jgi:hypothetical protein